MLGGQWRFCCLLLHIWRSTTLNEAATSNLYVSGATGNNAHIINGFYDAASMFLGQPSWQKQDEPQVWMVMLGDKWYVQEDPNNGGAKLAYSYAADSPILAPGWGVFVDGVWQSQAISVSEATSNIHINGATGNNAHTINGIYEASSPFLGQLSWQKHDEEGVFLVMRGDKWYVQNDPNNDGVRLAYSSAASLPMLATSWAVLADGKWETQSINVIEDSVATTTMIDSTTTAGESSGSIMLEGSLVMTVANVSQFIHEPNLYNTMKTALAEICEVSTTWVSILKVGLSLSSVDGTRLLQEAGAGNAEPPNELEMSLYGDIRVEFRIITPQNGDVEHIHATAIGKSFDEKSIEEINQIINTVIDSNLFGKKYEARVTYKAIGIVDSTSPRPSEPVNGDSLLTALLLVITICSIVVATVSAWLIRRLLRRSSLKRRGGTTRQRQSTRRPTKIVAPEKDAGFLEAAGSMGDWTVMELLSPPPAISAERHRHLLQLMSCMMCDVAECMVDAFVLYAVGHRDQDAEGSGPGFFHVAAVLKSLYTQGISCIFALPGVLDDNDFLTLLRTQEAHGKTLVVVETADLFNSRQFLESLYIAQEHGFDFMRIRMHAMPDCIDYRWPHIGKDDDEAVKMIKTLQSGYFMEPSYPESKSAVLDEPWVLETIADRMTNLTPVWSALRSCSSIGSVIADFDFDRVTSQESVPQDFDNFSSEDGTPLCGRAPPVQCVSSLPVQSFSSLPLQRRAHDVNSTKQRERKRRNSRDQKRTSRSSGSGSSGLRKPARMPVGYSRSEARGGKAKKKKSLTTSSLAVGRVRTIDSNGDATQSLKVKKSLATSSLAVGRVRTIDSNGDGTQSFKVKKSLATSSLAVGRVRSIDSYGDGTKSLKVKKSLATSSLAVGRVRTIDSYGDGTQSLKGKKSLATSSLVVGPLRTVDSEQTGDAANSLKVTRVNRRAGQQKMRLIVV